MHIDPVLLLGIFLVVGLGLLAYGLVIFTRTVRDVRRFTRTQGIITALDRRISRSSSDHSWYWVPTVQFHSADGQLREFVSSVGTTPAVGKVGSSIGVLYNPENPQEARVQHFLTLWLAPLVLLFIGIIFVLISAGGLSIVWFTRGILP